MMRTTVRSYMVWMVMLAGLAMGAQSQPPPAYGTSGAIDLDAGWRLWLDREAAWQDDVLYLPEDVNLETLPVNAPSGGWGVLDAKAGIPVTLPATVEEYYWDKEIEGLSPTEIVSTERPYLGVSWWFRTFTPPALKPGERAVLAIPAARMRAEVYVNGKLVGYNVITELPFTADATEALKPGVENQLALRITNPGGNYDWNDFHCMKWGEYEIPNSHGFGGLSDGVKLEVRAASAVTDLAVFNTPDPRTVNLAAEVASSGSAYSGPVRFEIRKAGKTVWNGTADIDLPADGKATVAVTATVPDAELWDIGHPALYAATADLGGMPRSDRMTVFGFRWFAAEGVGSNAVLRLNGRRVVLRSAITWGYFSPNGLFPDRAAVQREIDAVRSMGFNTLHNHRHMPKEIVLDAFDRAGLCRPCEPGAGQMVYLPEAPVEGPIDTSGEGGEATLFSARYARAKILGMIKAFRSHPSVLYWTIQNESEPDLRNPRIFRILREMKTLDPSRIVMLKSGALPRNQAWALPYSDTFMHDDGAGYSGWYDLHTACDSRGVYEDGLYQHPKAYKYGSGNTREVMSWGEMATGASADNHAAMARWYGENKQPGYDRAAHETLTAAYETFLDAYRFRAAFPTAEALFKRIGNKHYFSAARLQENARIADTLDCIVLNGWESTTVENHSGIVDALRNPKGDATVIRESSAPAMLVVRPRNLVLTKGTEAIVDVHLVNEIDLKGPFILSVSAAGADGTRTFEASYPVTVKGGDTFAEILKAEVHLATPVAGFVNIAATLAAPGSDEPTLTRMTQVYVVDKAPAPIGKRVACIYNGNSDRLVHALRRDFEIETVTVGLADEPVDVIIASTSNGGDWRPDGINTVQDTDDPGLYTAQRFGGPGAAFAYDGFAAGPIKVELFFAETCFDHAQARQFDVALNGEVVLKDFDIFAEAGGKARALVKTFIVDGTSAGRMAISVPRVGINYALMAAFRISDSNGTVVRRVLRDAAYTDVRGEVWTPVSLKSFAFLPKALQQVREGSRLVLLTADGNDAGQAAAALAEAGLLDYKGLVGHQPRYMSWMGFWYFGRKHWLLDGLPADGVLDWPYQVTGDGENGLLIQAPGLEAVIAFGRDHCTDIGVSAAVLPVGKGSIVLFCLPGLAPSFLDGGDRGMKAVTAQRMVYNAIQGEAR